MDCAPFIRNNLVLATWLTAPLLALLAMGLGLHSFLSHQHASYEKKEMLSEMIPLMKKQQLETTQFIETYKTSLGKRASSEELYIDLFNTASEQSGLTIESIHLEKESLDPETNVSRITLRLSGTGSHRQIAEFLNGIRQADSLIYEKEIEITPSGNITKDLQITASFLKIYVN